MTTSKTIFLSSDRFFYSKSNAGLLAFFLANAVLASAIYVKNKKNSKVAKISRAFIINTRISYKLLRKRQFKRLGSLSLSLLSKFFLYWYFWLFFKYLVEYSLYFLVYFFQKLPLTVQDLISWLGYWFFFFTFGLFVNFCLFIKNIFYSFFLHVPFFNTISLSFLLYFNNFLKIFFNFFSNLKHFLKKTEYFFFFLIFAGFLVEYLGYLMFFFLFIWILKNKAKAERELIFRQLYAKISLEKLIVYIKSESFQKVVKDFGKMIMYYSFFIVFMPYFIKNNPPPKIRLTN